jgi:hypothetical protein
MCTPQYTEEFIGCEGLIRIYSLYSFSVLLC